MIVDRETLVTSEVEAQELSNKLQKEEIALIRMVSPKRRKEGTAVLRQIIFAAQALERFDIMGTSEVNKNTYYLLRAKA